MSRVKRSVESVNSEEYDQLLELLREVRQSQGHGLASVSRKLGHDRNWVYRIEKKTRRIDVVEFCRFAEAVGVEPRDLFDQFLKRIGSK